MKNYIVTIKFPRFQRTFVRTADNIEEIYNKAAKALYRLRKEMNEEMLKLKFKADIEVIAKHCYVDTLPEEQFSIYTVAKKR